MEQSVRQAAERGGSLKRLLGRFVADLWTLRTMSLAVTHKLAAGEEAMVDAAIVKDLGNQFEQEIPRAL